MGCCESCFKQDGGAPLNKFAKPLLEADHLRMTVGGEKYPLLGSEEIMRPKLNGTCTKPTQQNLRYGVDSEKANHICCFNRNFAEDPGFFLLAEWHTTVNRKEATTYYDSVTGKPLFTAPKGRTFSTFMAESNALGWLSFRDHEVVWDNVRCLHDGEVVSLDGTHLGHNLPDANGNRYCINLVSVAGNPEHEAQNAQFVI